MTPAHPLGDPLPRNVAVLRALHLGDLLCAVPAFRALRAALPDARITLIGLPWARELVERLKKYLDGFLEFPGYPGLPERAARLEGLPAFLSEAHRRNFDLAIQMHGSGTISNPLTVLLAAHLNVGFYVPGQFCPDEERFLPYPDDEPEVWRHLLLMEHLGVAPRGEALEFPLEAQDHEELQAVSQARDLRPGDYVCLHPGARQEARRWPAERFARVADLLSKAGLQVALTGTAEESSLTRAVTRAMRSPAVDLAGRTNLGSLAALLSGARLLVSNDTGVSHLAAALRIPSVVIFNASKPARWAPLDREIHRVVTPPVDSPDAVLEEAEDLLEKEFALPV